MPDSKTIDADADLASLVGTVAAPPTGEGALVAGQQAVAVQRQRPQLQWEMVNRARRNRD